MLANTLASDNENTLYLANIDNSIESINSNGKKLWQSDLAYNINSNLIVFREKLLVIVKTNEQKSLKYSKLIIINKENGLLEKTIILPISDYSILSLSNNELVTITSEDTLLMIDKTFNIIWIKDLNTKIVNSLVLSDKQLLIASTNKTFIKVDQENNKILTQLNLKNIPSGNFSADQHKIFHGDILGNVYSLDIVSNKQIWNTFTGGKIIGIDKWNDYLVVLSNDNYLYLIKKDNGKKIWKKRLAGRLIGNMLLDDENIIVLTHGTNTGLIINLRKKSIINKILIDEDEYFVSKPILSDNKIIVSTQNRLLSFSNLCQ